MDYKIIKDKQGFINEKENWNNVMSHMLNATPFQTWEWNYIWWNNNEAPETLFIIKAFEAGEIYGYAPLVVKNNTAEFIGGSDMDYGKFVVYEKMMIVIEGFVSILLENGIAISFQEMAARDSQLHMIQKILENKKGYLCHKTTRSAYVNISQYANFDTYFKLLSKSMRNKTIKVGLKKNLLLNKEEVTDELLEELKKIYLNRQEVRIGTSTLKWAIPIIKEMNKAGLLDIYIARYQDEAVGFLVSMKSKKSQYIWLVAFKQEYKNCFPGQLLFYQVIKDSFGFNNERVDFMRGDYDFKMRWECELDTNYTVYYFRSHLKYWKYKMFFYLKPRIKKLIYSHSWIERLYKKYA